MKIQSRYPRKLLQACSDLRSMYTSRNGKITRRAGVRPVGGLCLGLLLSVALLFVQAINAVPAKAAINAGTFAPKVDFPTNLGPTGVALGDLDGDGKADVAVANDGALDNIGTTVSVLRNTGTSGVISFAPKLDFHTGNGPHSVLLADIDGDGKPDLVTSNYDAYALGTTVSVLRNTSTIGDISFAPKVDLVTGNGPVGIVVADIDGDGEPDLAVTDFADGAGNTVSVLRNTSTPGTVSFAPKVDFGTGAGPYGIAGGDVNGDGKPDLAIVNFGAVGTGDGNTVSVLRNTSTSGSLSFAAKVDFTTGVGPRGVVLTDFDGDGKPDLATTNFGAGGGGNSVSILRNTGTSGSVSFGPKSDLTADAGALGIASGDLDGDGKPDLAVTDFGTNWPKAVDFGTTVSVFGNTSVPGTISFAPKVDYGTGAAPHALSISDVNQDNKPDLAVVNYGNADGMTVSVLQNITGITFNTPTPTSIGLNRPTDTPTPTQTPTVLSTPTSTPTPTTDLLFDDFPGSSLSASWDVPFGGAPTLSGGTALFNGGNTIESTASFAASTVFEIQARYSLASYTGLCWTNSVVTNFVCWVPLSTNTSHFALFTSDGGETDTGVSVPSGYHRYAIARNGGAFAVYMDGAAIYSANDSAVSVDRAYLSGDGGFTVDWACVYAAGSSCQGAGSAVPVDTPTPTPTGPSTSTSTPTPTSTGLNTPTSTPTQTPTTDLLFDSFSGSSLSPWWYVPFGGVPGISGGLAVFNGGNTIESTASFSASTAFEILAQYSPSSYTGLCWTNSHVSNYVCWIPLSSNTSHFAWFTTDGGETDTGLAVPSGYHRYAITRNGSSFAVFMDGSPVYAASDSAVSVDRAYLSGYGGFAVDWACVYTAGSSCQGAGPLVPTATPTSTPVPPTATNMPTDTPVAPTATDTPTSTRTNTPSTTPTSTPVPSTATNAPTSTATRTFIPPAATNTPTATSTNTATSTPVPATNTGFLAPSAQAPQISSAGDNNGYELNRSNVLASDGLVAADMNSGTNTSTSCTNSGKDKHLFYNFNFGVPSGAAIQGVQVRLHARADSTSNSPHLCVQVSWNGGSSWTAARQSTTLGTTEATYVLGGPSDSWGRSWTASNLTNANFRIRIADVASSTGRDFYLDYIAVNVTYQGGLTAQRRNQAP